MSKRHVYIVDRLLRTKTNGNDEQSVNLHGANIENNPSTLTHESAFVRESGIRAMFYRTN